MDPGVDYFKKLFEVSPNAYMVLDRELRYVAANPVYLRETGSRLDQLLGRYVFDLFPNDPDDPGNASARMLQRSLERVLATGERDHLALIPYRVPKEVDGALVTEERFWSATHSPVLDADGRVGFILQHTVDVTELHALTRASAPRRGSAVAEAGVLSRAQAVQQENVKLDAEREQLRSLFEQAPGFMAFLEGREFVFSLANAAYLRLIGRGDVLAKPLALVLPEVVEQGFVQLLTDVFTRGEPYVGIDTRLLLQRQTSGPPDEVFVDFVYQPVREDGQVRGIFVQGHDVTARKLAEREREAAHRAAMAFSEELLEQSRLVKETLDRANARIRELEGQLAER
jgi:PAS domain S-box-containing protein